VVGCNSSTDTTQGTTGGGTGKELRVGVVFDSGGRGDKSFNDSAWAGVERAKQDSAIKVSAVDSKAAKDYEGNLTALADKGMDVIFAVGLAQQDALKTVAPKYPDIKFAIVDGEVDGPNIRNLKFTEEQGSFLAGYLAGLMTETGKIGFVGGMNIPLIGKFEAGYRAGAITANPAVQVLPAKFTESWDDVGLGKAAARTLFDAGADIVYHAAGRAGLGVIDAAEETHRYAIGVDSDQDYVAEGSVLTSMVKKVDTAVFETITDVRNGTFTSGTKMYDLKANGVGLSEMKFTKDKIGAAKLAQVEAVRQKILDGSIKVPTSLNELKGFRPPGK
jgi:basic membrane protein A